jgi:hypothetical protein
MSKTITLEIPDEVFGIYQQQAERKGETAEKIVLEYVIKNAPRRKTDGGFKNDEAEKRFERWIGAISSGNPRSADNEQIDAELVEEYGKDL